MGPVPVVQQPEHGKGPIWKLPAACGRMTGNRKLYAGPKSACVK
jgi:hypothetical protein